MYMYCQQQEQHMRQGVIGKIDCEKEGMRGEYQSEKHQGPEGG